jgi:hypothetical protein
MEKSWGLLRVNNDTQAMQLAIKDFEKELKLQHKPRTAAKKETTKYYDLV